MVSFIPDCMSDKFSSNNNACFEHPALSATLFRMVRVKKKKDKKYTQRKTRPRLRLLLNLVFDFTMPFQDKIK